MLDQVFQLLKRYTTPTAFQVAGEANIAHAIACLCPSTSDRWASDKASRIIAAAKNNPFQKVSYSSYLINLALYVDLLLQYQEHLSYLRSQVDALAEEVETYRLSNRFPA